MMCNILMCICPKDFALQNPTVTCIRTVQLQRKSDRNTGVPLVKFCLQNKHLQSLHRLIWSEIARPRPLPGGQ